MKQRVRDLVEMGGKLFTERQSLDSFWQEVALNFYVEMADFTYKRDRGEDYADHLVSSYPLLARRSLGDAFAAMLRPKALDNVNPGVWFQVNTRNENVNKDVSNQRWLEYATKIQKRAMYDPHAGFSRATKEADHMFATFGNSPLTVELNLKENALLYRSYHLRDVVWSENEAGQIARIHRSWKPYAIEVQKRFKNPGPKITEMANDPKRKFERVECRHIVLPAEEYEGGNRWMSIYVDVQNEHILEEKNVRRKGYIIPRWVTIPGSQYASSPAVTVALPDARLIQAMTLTLLEAGEKHADPPLLATEEAVRSDINTFAGGVTYIDSEYDERMGDAMRPLYNQRTGEGLSYAVGMAERIESTIARAFYLDSLQLPQSATVEMTAFEVSQRISEWIRRAMPIFEPVEYEYNAPLCEETFGILWENGAFGPDIPKDIKNEMERGMEFTFESPLHESAEKRKGQKFLEAKAALLEAAQLDPAAIATLNATDALKDVLKGIGVPASWRASDSEIEAYRRKQQEQQALEATLATMNEGGQAAESLGAAAKNFSEVGG